MAGQTPPTIGYTAHDATTNARLRRTPLNAGPSRSPIALRTGSGATPGDGYW